MMNDAVIAQGCDFSFADPKPSIADLKAHGIEFVCRYLSQDAAKDLTAEEYLAYHANGIDVVLIWETAANRMLDAGGAGVSDARAADTLRHDIGIPGAPPIYFACDFDATPADQAPINAYLAGVASVITKARLGMYAGYWPLSRAFDAGLISFGWQTSAWSGGHWDIRAQLQQIGITADIAGITVDIDHATFPDFGQVNYKAPAPVPTTSGTQAGWKYCDKCGALYWLHGVAGSVCAAGGTHFTKPGQYTYSLPWSLP